MKDVPLQHLPGVGIAVTDKLGPLGIRTVGDLLEMSLVNYFIWKAVDKFY